VAAADTEKTALLELNAGVRALACQFETACNPPDSCKAKPALV